MDRVIDLLNIAACGLLSTGCLWAVLSPRVQDGIVIKLGLGLLAAGFFGVGMALAGERPQFVIERALALVHLGLLVVGAGIALRWKRAGRVYRVDEWITPPTVAQRKPQHFGSTLAMEDEQRGGRL